jgi:hypothetical protein
MAFAGGSSQTFLGVLSSLRVLDGAVVNRAAAALKTSAAQDDAPAFPRGPFGPLEAVARSLREAGVLGDTSAGGSVPAVVADANWLVQLCAAHLASADESSTWSPQTLGTQVLELSRHNDFEGGLFDLLGERGLETMLALVEHRAELAAVRLPDFRRLCEVYAAEEALTALGSSALAPSALGRRAGPSFGTGVTVHSESALRAEKARLKAEGKLERHRAALLQAVDHAQGHDVVDVVAHVGVEDQFDRGGE